jgi:predicted kinase
MVHENPGKYVRVNRDDLRAMMHVSHFSKGNEKIVTDMCHTIAKYALSQGRNVIVDETSLNPKVQIDYERLIEIGCANMTDRTITLEVKHFDKSVEDCIRDDAMRDKPVGKRVILEMYWRWIAKPEPVVTVDDPNKKNAIICDLDGTLAEISHRSPYDASKAENDGVNTHVLETVRRFSKDHVVIFVSGRDDEFEPQTRKFLEREIAGEFQYLLYMRKTGDKRDDALVKRDIYDEHVGSCFNVKLAIDDRPRVIRLWRSLGVPVFDCGLGIEF